jgi:hypothetical protein
VAELEKELRHRQKREELRMLLKAEGGKKGPDPSHDR